MPELQSRPYQHQSPRRPARLPFRRTPPPERSAPPSLRWLLYLGVALTGILIALGVPYLVTYLLSAMSAPS